MDDVAIVGKDVLLVDTELPVEDLEELSLYSVHISLAKDTGGQSPVNVF